MAAGCLSDCPGVGRRALHERPSLSFPIRTSTVLDNQYFSELPSALLSGLRLPDRYSTDSGVVDHFCIEDCTTDRFGENELTLNRSRRAAFQRCPGRRHCAPFFRGNGAWARRGGGAVRHISASVSWSAVRS